ncbi:ion channel [Novosphingobium mangrovi (ex Huang et al. 2023)]|uniref:Ion channel n=1 Tax=Novosphingobium mangrovi (ex Huang et al. 2023) TaxID=2976432 RepID=A0ABT2I272_9SPHN|nr:ion channel [Novosphingobium mangrovi (ex Huang et al. 2023)]MCT2398894.1 ion channel [Novosphingobium mangrovi (ex Huang et al. 2023)]
MTIRSRLTALYEGDSSYSRAYSYFLLIFDIVMILYVITSSFFLGSRAIEIIDALLGVVIIFDFFARLIVSRFRIRTLFSVWGAADLVVILSLLAPIAGEGFAFLRVVRTFRLLRSYHLLKQLRGDFLYFRRNEATIFAVLNLGLFIFVTTALVFETQHGSNPRIQNYADALYFTVTTLTTTGFGDITLPGATGRLLSVAIMIFGVSLFVRLIQVVFRPPKVEYECKGCGLLRHDPDAIHCKHCGSLLHIPNEGSS